MVFGETGGKEPDTTPRWYACYTRARHEKRVERQLEERGFESWLPVVERDRQWSDRTKRVEFPVFPSYVFCRFPASRIHEILTVPGVSTVVRIDGRPAAIRDEEMENIRRFVDALGSSQLEPEPVPFIREGQPVRVVDGPFEGVTGIAVERRGRRRVLVGLDAIRQGFEVDVPAASLEPIRGSGGPR